MEKIVHDANCYKMVDIIEQQSINRRTSLLKSAKTSSLFLFLCICLGGIGKLFKPENQGFLSKLEFTAVFNPFTAMGDLIDFTLSNARRFYSSKGQNLAAKGLKTNNISWFQNLILEHFFKTSFPYAV